MTSAMPVIMGQERQTTQSLPASLPATPTTSNPKEQGTSHVLSRENTTAAPFSRLLLLLLFYYTCLIFFFKFSKHPDGDKHRWQRPSSGWTKRQRRGPSLQWQQRGAVAPRRSVGPTPTLPGVHAGGGCAATAPTTGSRPVSRSPPCPPSSPPRVCPSASGRRRRRRCCSIASPAPANHAPAQLRRWDASATNRLCAPSCHASPPSSPPPSSSRHDGSSRWASSTSADSLGCTHGPTTRWWYAVSHLPVAHTL